MKHRDEILQPPLHLSAHIMEGKPKILGTNPKSEEIISFYPIFLCILRTCSDYVQQNCHVLVTVIYNLNLACQHKKLEITNLKKFCNFISYLVYVWTFILRCR